MRKITAGALILGAGLAAAVAALPACSSELGNCGLITIVSAQDSVSLAVGDSVRLAAGLASGCPGSVGIAVDFSSGDPSIVNVRTVTDTSAWARGVSPGRAFVAIVGRARTQVRGGVIVTVH